MSQFTKDGIARVRSVDSTEANRARAYIERYDFTGRRTVASARGYGIFVVQQMIDQAYFVRHEKNAVGRTGQIVISPDTWEIVKQSHLAIGVLVDGAIDGAAGMRFLSYDEEPYRTAVRSLNPRVANVYDVESVERRAEALLVAAGNHTGTDLLQTQLLMADYNALLEEVAEMQRRLAIVQNKIETAGEAAFGA